MKGISRVNSFLVEIIMVILFFSLSAVITLQVFVATQKRENQSEQISMAVILTQQVTEQYRAAGQNCPWFSAASNENGKKVLWYDENWNKAGEPSDTGFKLYFSVQNEPLASGTMVHTTAEMCSEDKNGNEQVIYTLTSKAYQSALSNQ